MDEKSLNETGHVPNPGFLEKMPTATLEQLSIAKLLKKSDDDDTSLRSYVAQLQELTKCTEDQAVTALYDCENNLERAVDLLLDRLHLDHDEGWHTTTAKRTKAKPTNDQDPNVKQENKKLHTRNKNRKGNANSRDTSSNVGVEDSEAMAHTKEFRSRKPGNGPFNKNSVVKSRATENGERKKGESKNSTPPQNARQNRNKVPKSEPDTWDPYTEYGNWGGGSMEVVNSDAAIAKGLQGDVCIPNELLTEVDGDTISFCNEPAQTESAQSSNDDTSSPSSFDSESLFAHKVMSKPLPNMFERIPNVPVFIKPGVVPDIPLRWSVKFGGECVAPVTVLHTPQQPNSGLKKSPVVQSSHESVLSQPNLSEPKLEVNKLSTGFNALNERNKSHDNSELGTDTFTNNQYKPPIAQNMSIYSNSQGSQNVGFGSTGNASQSAFLEQPFKNYLLNQLPNEMNTLSVGDPAPKAVKAPQFGLPASAQNPQNKAVHQTSQNFQHQIVKGNLAQPSANEVVHTSQPVLSNVAQSHQQQPTTMPPGVPHFIGQFPTAAAYHMFNLPGSSSSGPALLDIDQLQFLQQQQRILYDAHLQQQAATTAHSLFTSTSEAPSVSKPMVPNIQGSVTHATVANASMRPEMLASAMGHAPQMMATGHPYPYYPGFLLMNGYANPFLNQQQPHQHAGQESVHSQSSVSSQSQPQSHGSMKTSNASVGPYDDLLEMNFGDQSKQVGYKGNPNQPHYGHFQSQAVSSEAMGSKLPQATHSANSNLPQPYNQAGGGGGLHSQQYPSQLYQSVSASAPYLQAAVAVAAVAAASASASVKASAQQQQGSSANSAANSSSIGSGHLTGQGMVVGQSGSNLHHARAVMQHQHQ